MSGYVEFRNKLLENPEVRAQYEAINYPRPRRDGVWKNPWLTSLSVLNTTLYMNT